MPVAPAQKREMRMVDPLRKTSGGRWKKLRERIIRRDKGLCQECWRKGRVTAGSQVDHIVAICNGGTDDQGNLQLLCAGCHEAKTAEDTGKTWRAPTGLDGWPVKT